MVDMEPKLKATLLAALYILERDGLLDGLTQQQIADALGFANRSSGLRYVRALADVRVEYARVLDTITDGIRHARAHPAPPRGRRWQK
jgi:hypothetical protein